MKKMNILNGEGKTIAIRVKEIEKGTYVPTKTDENVYCLTCGTEELNQLDVINVGVQQLKGWLEEKQHFTNNDSNVILCNRCQEEAIY